MAANWTWEENKKFEMGLVDYPEGTPNRWEKIAATLETKSAMDVEQNHVDLLAEIEAIEAGLVPLPSYSEMKSEKKVIKKAGRAWTDEEHRRFLVGLEKYEKGDWKSISRNCVLTRSSSQVASHAQKYFKRQRQIQQESASSRKKRSSIFDTSIGETSNTKSADKVK